MQSKGKCKEIHINPLIMTPIHINFGGIRGKCLHFWKKRLCQNMMTVEQ